MASRSLIRSNGWLHLTLGFLISALGLWIFLGVTEDVVHNDPLTQFDLTLLNWLQAHHGQFGDQLFRAISGLGSPWVLIPLALVITVFLVIQKQGLLLEGWLLAFLGGFLLNNILKRAIHRPRPYPGAAEYSSWSFPSGHAMVSLIAYGMVAYVLILLGPRNRRALARDRCGCRTAGTGDRIQQALPRRPLLQRRRGGLRRRHALVVRVHLGARGDAPLARHIAPLVTFAA